MSTPHRNKLAKPLAVGTLLLAAFAVGAAVYVTGTPMQQRQARIDERRTDQLQVLERQIHEYADDHGKAWPASLDALARPGLRVVSHDPATDAPYEYRVIDAKTFELCATFASDSAQVTNEFRPSDAWAHGIGRQCFERRAKQEKAASAE